MYLVLLTVVFFNVYVVFMWQEKPGKYKAIVKALEQCPDSHVLPLRFGNKIRRFNRSVTTYSSEINLPYDLDDTFSVQINVAKNGNGGYKENYYNVKLDNLCTMIQTLIPHMFKDALHSAGLKIDTCPVPKGTYYVHDYIMTLGNVQGMPEAMYGEFRGEVNFYKVHENGTEERVCCLRGYYELKPK